MVVMVPCPTGETARGDVTLQHYAEWLDGVVMHGGADVARQLWRRTPARGMDWRPRARHLRPALVKAFAEVGKPIFGVCRGCSSSTWPLAARCTRTSKPSTPAHCSTATPSPYDQHFHDIQIVPDSRLAQLYPNPPRARVNSIHHQGIKRVAPDFVVEALSEPDGVPEAIRVKPAPGRGYIAATQWHP